MENQKDWEKLLRQARISSKREKTYVDDDDSIISTKPIYTDFVVDCVATVLLGWPNCAMLHYFWERKNRDTIPPRIYLPPVVEELASKSIDSITAVVIGGHKGHFRSVKYHLGKLGIPIVASYLDGLYPLKSGDKHIPDNAKELLVIPLEQRVIMSSERDGYLQLFPKLI